MYEKDKSQRVTLRLTMDQFLFVKKSADRLGVSPSDFLRMVINSTMFGYQEGSRRENETMDHDNKL